MKVYKQTKSLNEGQFTVLNVDEQKKIKGGGDFIVIEDLTEM